MDSRVVLRHAPHCMADDSFKDFVLDQLSGLSGLRAKAMFGGHGLYQEDRFFGILMDGRLYFKTDDESRKAYLERGMAPFVYEKARRTMAMRYYEVAAEVLENREELIAWASRAVQAAAEPSQQLNRRINPRSTKRSRRTMKN